LKLLVIGAKSDIAIATARVFAQNGYDLILAGRNISELILDANDIKIRYSINIELVEFDIEQFETHENFVKNINVNIIDGVLISVGYMQEQKVCEKNFNETLRTINVNFTGVVSILNIIANIFENRKSGFIIAISSVAGDRGRKTNYIYGSSKAGLSAYLSGLRGRLFSSQVQVLTVKPGFVNTRMTEKLKLPEKLTAEPEDIADAIFKAYKNRNNILYYLQIWKYIMLIIKHIPEFIFKRLSI